MWFAVGHEGMVALSVGPVDAFVFYAFIENDSRPSPVADGVEGDTFVGFGSGVYEIVYCTRSSSNVGEQRHIVGFKLAASHIVHQAGHFSCSGEVLGCGSIHNHGMNGCQLVWVGSLGGCIVGDIVICGASSQHGYRQENAV